MSCGCGVASRIARHEPVCNDRVVGLTVLIVDDHSGFRARARALLESEGFEIVGEADDGESALVEIGRLEPDVVLLDVQLPNMDGLEVARRLSADGGRSQVVLTSSRDARDLGPLLSASGARGFIPKAELSGDGIRGLLR
jgi:DNA-binding NarL/FixJ family response regulator